VIRVAEILVEGRRVAAAVGLVPARLPLLLLSAVVAAGGGGGHGLPAAARPLPLVPEQLVQQVEVVLVVFWGDVDRAAWNK